MSILYNGDPKVSVSWGLCGDGNSFVFSCDGGKFGTDEIIDEIQISTDELYRILEAWQEKKDCTHNWDFRVPLGGLDYRCAYCGREVKE